MKIQKKIFKFGTSCGIILDKIILKSLNLKEGDWINIDFEKFQYTEEDVEEKKK